MAIPPYDPERPPFATEFELRRWLRAEGIEHVLRATLDVLAPKLDSDLWGELLAVARRPLAELACAESIVRWKRSLPLVSHLRDRLPRLVWAYLDDEANAAAEGRRTVDELLATPDDPRAVEPHRLLVALRAKLPTFLAPRPLRLLRPDLLRYDEDLPGLRYREDRGFAATVTSGTITIVPSGAKTDCSCGAPFCVHRLAAIDATLLWLRSPADRWQGTPTETLTELLRPSWQRTLQALEVAFDERANPTGTIDLSWRMQILESYGIIVTPYLHQRNKKGQRSNGTRMNKRRLTLEFATRLDPVDARLVALLPELDGAAPLTLLHELAHHPQVLLEEAPDVVVRIDRAKVGLVAEERNGTVVVTAGVDGAAFPPSLFDRVRAAKAQDVLYLFDPGAHRLTLLDVGTEMRALLGVLLRHGNVFPPESHGALIERLSTLAQRLPVAMPRSILGEAIPPDYRPVVRLEAQPDGSLRIELRCRPLPESAALVPGLGGKDVHVRREKQPVHAIRDFAVETTTAEALGRALPLDHAEPQNTPFSFLLTDLEDCLALVAACENAVPQPELEWVSSPLRVLPTQSAVALKVTIQRKKSWFGVLGGLTVGGERVELARLLDAARRKDRFVKVVDQSYIELSETLREQLLKLADHAHDSKHGVELGPSAVQVIAELERAGATVKSDDRWQTLVERIAAAKQLEPRVPATLKTELRSYQDEGFRWLTRLASWGAGAILADDMGLGKTIQALAVLLDRGSLGPALVLAPTSVAFNWVEEAARFAPSLKLTLFADVDDRQATLAKLGPNDVLVASYGLLSRDLPRLASVKFATIIFDEAQSLKNAATQRSKAARVLDGDFKIALSGTPLENHLGELWSLFNVVFPELLGSWQSFRTRFAAPIEKRTDPDASKALARVIQPFLLRRTKAQVESQLPPRTDVRVPVVLSPPEWQLYEDARLATLSELDTSKVRLREQERRIEVLAALTRLRLLASHPRLYDPASKVESAKLERFMELVRELIDEGHRALVFSQFTSHLALVREVLDAEGITYEYLDGSTPQGERGDRVRSFQGGTAQLFLISLKAGGFGLNLTAATSVIHLDPWWNPAVEDQASDRAHRLGQTRPVTVYRLVTRGTIEEQMLALHEDKRALVADVLEGKDQAARLSTRDLLDLLATSPHARTAPIAIS